MTGKITLDKADVLELWRQELIDNKYGMQKYAERCIKLLTYEIAKECEK